MDVICPLCASLKNRPYADGRYHNCENCQGLFLPAHNLPKSEEEKKRYDLHTSTLKDAGYHEYIKPLIHAIFRCQNIGEKCLDFGSGPNSVLSSTLKSAGFSVYQYDPFYQNDLTVLQQQYDFIVACEVVEHFHFPKREFNRLSQTLLKQNGLLYIMTQTFSGSEDDFRNWHYRRDITHVFIYRNETMQWIHQHFSFKELSAEGRVFVFNK